MDILGNKDNVYTAETKLCDDEQNVDKNSTKITKPQIQTLDRSLTLSKSKTGFKISCWLIHP